MTLVHIRVLLLVHVIFLSNASKPLQDPITRVKIVDSWLMGHPQQNQQQITTWSSFLRLFQGGNPQAPDWWIIHDVSQLSHNLTLMKRNLNKEVHKSFITNKVDKSLQQVVVKRSVSNKMVEELHKEIIFLEYLRDAPGIPKLYGGWFDKNGLNCVVEFVEGDAIGEGQGLVTSPTQMSTKFKQAASSHPYRLAHALVACFHSFSQLGGYFKADLLPKDFIMTRNKKNEYTITMIGTPEPLFGEIVAYYRSSYSSSTTSLYQNSNKVPCGSNKDCPSTNFVSHCCRRNTIAAANHHHQQQHVDNDVCEDDNFPSPESRGICSMKKERCLGVTSRTHVFDMGGKNWLLPAIIKEASKGSRNYAAQDLNKLVSLMTHQNPNARIRFSKALDMVKVWAHNTSRLHVQFPL
jgi:hypothetical protein